MNTPILLLIDYAERDKRILDEINAFDEQCEAEEYTDTDQAWNLLYWIREQLAPSNQE